MWKHITILMMLCISGINGGPFTFATCYAMCMTAGVVVTAPVTGRAPALICGPTACTTFCYLLLGIPSP